MMGLCLGDILRSLESESIFNNDEKQAELNGLIGSVCNILVKEGKTGLAKKLAKGNIGLRINLLFGKDYLFIVPNNDKEVIDLKNYDLISNGNQLIYLNKKVSLEREYGV